MKKIIIAFFYFGVLFLFCKKSKEGDPSKVVLTEIETSTNIQTSL